MEAIVESVTLLIIVINAFITLIEFKSNNIIKKAKLIEKLINEFHNSKLVFARS